MTDRRKPHHLDRANTLGTFVGGLVIGFLLTWCAHALIARDPEPTSKTYSSANHKCVKGPDGMCERWEL